MSQKLYTKKQVLYYSFFPKKFVFVRITHFFTILKLSCTDYSFTTKIAGKYKLYFKVFKLSRCTDDKTESTLYYK